MSADIWPVLFCPGCGRQMRPFRRRNGFSTDTGKPIYEIWARCTVNAVRRYFGWHPMAELDRNMWTFPFSDGPGPA